MGTSPEPERALHAALANIRKSPTLRGKLAIVMHAIRPARINDLPRLGEIERASVELFRGHQAYEAFRAAPTDAKLLGDAIAAQRAWVACDEDAVAGFIVVSTLDGCAHIEEVDVHPAFGRRGWGARLLRHACDWAKAGGYPAITLATLCDVPWNAPFYRKHGFAVVPASELGPEHVRAREHEVRAGFPMHLRVFMRRRLHASGDAR